MQEGGEVTLIIVPNYSFTHPTVFSYIPVKIWIKMSIASKTTFTIL